jgi:hypothetical protein
MRRVDALGVACLCGVIAVDILLMPSSVVGTAGIQAAEPAACAPPTQELATPEETAWRLFVSANCSVNRNKYPYTTWETWIEQTQLYQSRADFLAHRHFARFHRSPLAEFLRRSRGNKNAGPQLLLLLPNQGCGTGSSGRTICEETRINADSATYITSNGLATKAGQKAFVSAGKQFVFTRPSVEIKADWVQLASCSNPPSDVHVEAVSGKCYALAGLHLISKLIDKWVWATFEPQNTMTNPQRCKVLGCTDSWGSNPATTSGAQTGLTAGLTKLMNDADVAPEWRNYRLDGVQVDFLDGSAKPTVLGNSIIEGDNAGTPAEMKRSSCISCHARSTVATGAAQPLLPEFVVGTLPPLQTGITERDFVWSLSQAK